MYLVTTTRNFEDSTDFSEVLILNDHFPLPTLSNLVSGRSGSERYCF